MDWDAIIRYLPLYGKATLLTLKLGIAGIALSLLIGLFCTVVKYWKIPVLKQIVNVYIEISRNTPLLIQLFFIYYALPKIGILTEPETCGIFGLAFLGGSYMAESLRSGFENIEKNQLESAAALGMKPWQTLFFVVLPQAFCISFPSVVANVIFLLKETSVFSTVSLLDLMFTAKDLIGTESKTIECMLLLVIFYAMIIIPVSVLGSILERRLRHAGFGT